MTINESNYQTSANVYITVLNSPELPPTDDNCASIRLQGPENQTAQSIITAISKQLEDLSEQMTAIRKPINISKTIQFPISVVGCMSAVIIFTITFIVLSIIGGPALPFIFCVVGTVPLALLIAIVDCIVCRIFASKHDYLIEQNQKFLCQIFSSSKINQIKNKSQQDFVYYLDNNIYSIKERINVLNLMKTKQFFYFISISTRSEILQKIQNENASILVRRRENLWEKLIEYQQKFDEENEIAKRHATEAASTMATAELSTNPGEITEDFSKRFLIPTLIDYLLPESSQEGKR